MAGARVPRAMAGGGPCSAPPRSAGSAATAGWDLRGGRGAVTVGEGPPPPPAVVGAATHHLFCTQAVRSKIDGRD